MPESVAAGYSAPLFETSRAVAVAPVLTSLSAVLTRVTPQEMRMNPDLFSRSLIAGARFFRPDILWLNFTDLPELSLVTEYLDATALDRMHLSASWKAVDVESVTATYVQTLANLTAVIDLPVVATMLGPRLLKSFLTCPIPRAELLMESVLQWARNTIQRYSRAGARGICVLETRFDQQTDFDAFSLRYLADLQRISRSLGLASWLFLSDRDTPDLKNAFDCVIYPADVFIQDPIADRPLGLAIDFTDWPNSERLSKLERFPGGIVAPPLVLASTVEIVPSAGVAQARLMIDLMRSFGNRCIMRLTT